MLIKGLALNTELTAARLRELLHYEPQTGAFTWNVPPRNAKAGDIAGGVRRDGYVSIRCDGASYVAHRLAWLYVTGEWPGQDIDHRDGVRSNNAFGNLREASDSENAQNRAIRSDNSSGFPGVCRHKGKGGWQAKIGINGRRLYLGLFETPEEAHAAYLRAKEQLHTFQPVHRSGAVPAANDPSIASLA